jgi:hypothetical protein
VSAQDPGGVVYAKSWREGAANGPSAFNGITRHGDSYDGEEKREIGCHVVCFAETVDGCEYMISSTTHMYSKHTTHSGLWIIFRYVG